MRMTSRLGIVFIVVSIKTDRKKVCVMLWPVYLFIPNLQLQIAQVLMGEYVLSWLSVFLTWHSNMLAQLHTPACSVETSVNT